MVEIPIDVNLEELDDVKFQYTPVKGAKPAGDPADMRRL